MKYCHTLLRAVEGRCEKVAEDLLGNQREPDLAEGVALMEERRFKHCIAGETSINVEPPPQHLVRRDAEATVHLNPIFCCTRGGSGPRSTGGCRKNTGCRSSTS